MQQGSHQPSHPPFSPSSLRPSLPPSPPASPPQHIRQHALRHKGCPRKEAGEVGCRAHSLVGGKGGRGGEGEGEEVLQEGGGAEGGGVQGTGEEEEELQGEREGEKREGGMKHTGQKRMPEGNSANGGVTVWPRTSPWRTALHTRGHAEPMEQETPGRQTNPRETDSGAPYRPHGHCWAVRRRAAQGTAVQGNAGQGHTCVNLLRCVWRMVESNERSNEACT